MRLSEFELHGTALVQTLEAEMQRITKPPGGDVTELDPDTQDLLLSYSKAATEPKSYYRQVQKSSPGLPPYEEVIWGRLSCPAGVNRSLRHPRRAPPAFTAPLLHCNKGIQAGDL